MRAILTGIIIFIMNQNYISTLPSSCPTQETDIERLKHLFHQLLQKGPQPSDWLKRQSQYKHKIGEMQTKILELSGRLAQLESQHFQTYKQLQKQRESQKAQRQQFEHKLKKANETSKDRDFWSTPQKDIKNSQFKHIQTVSHYKPPVFTDIKRNETLIDELIQLQQSKVSTDQIHRLNSYLVQNTTSLKLLAQKCNYLIKLRQMNHSNLSQELQVIKKTKELVSNRKVADQAKTVLYKSRKAYFQSDHSSSEIQAETNNLGEKQEYP